MIVPEKAPAVLQSPFLHGLSPSDLAAVLAAASRRHFLAGEVLVHAGDPAGHVYLLVSGRARSYTITDQGRRLKIRCHTPGDVFGLRALLSRAATYTVSTEMGRDGCVLVWDRAAIWRLALQHPVLLTNALSLLSERLARYVKLHVALTCHSAEERMAQVLIDLGASIGRAVPLGTEFDITNEYLADMASVTLFTASRLLSSWHRRGAIVKSRGRIVLRFPELLLAPSDSQSSVSRG